MIVRGERAEGILADLQPKHHENPKQLDLPFYRQFIDVESYITPELGPECRDLWTITA